MWSPFWMLLHCPHTFHTERLYTENFRNIRLLTEIYTYVQYSKKNDKMHLYYRHLLNKTDSLLLFAE